MGDNKLIQRAISNVYKFHECGGSLHIAIDDGNLDDASLNFCEKYVNNNGGNFSQEQLIVERECLNLLRQLSEDEREDIYAEYHRHN